MDAHKSIGESYAKAVSAVISRATDKERHDSDYITRSIKEELQKIHAQRREKRLTGKRKG
jgi:hypothetical protein